MTTLSIDKAISMAESLASSGNTATAMDLYKEVLQYFPDHKEAKQGVANLSLLNKVDSSTPPPQTLQRLTNLFNKGEKQELADQASSVAKQFPHSFMAWTFLGAANMGLGKIEIAESNFRKACELNPFYPDAHNSLGIALKTQNKPDEAITAYDKAISIKPDYAEAHYNKAIALSQKGEVDEAIKAYEKALSVKPDYVDAYMNLGTLFSGKGQQENALKAYQSVLKIKPSFAQAYNNMGNLFADQDRLDDAQSAFDTAIELKNDYPEAHRNLSFIKKYSPADPQVKLLENLLDRVDLNDFDRCNLSFALAKAYDDLNRVEDAFTLLKQGNKLRKQYLAYDIEQDNRLFAKIKNTAPKIRETPLPRNHNPSSPSPIFIIGMPRSGTTLVEQIISSHTQVQGAGELCFIKKHGSDINTGEIAADKSSIELFRDNYLSDISKISTGQKFITDKMPHNFCYVGLICSAMPNAKIINVERCAKATCWSNFKNYFSSAGLAYSYDLHDIVVQYKLYRDLMDFWMQAYSTRIYHLDYEKLTTQQDAETKKLINYLGVRWEKDCLSPHKNKRSVRTASQQQVRERIYRGSSDEWRRYEPFVGDVFENL